MFSSSATNSDTNYDVPSLASSLKAVSEDKKPNCCKANWLIFLAKFEMSVFHDEVEIEDFEYDAEKEMYYYPCPCGDRFEISLEQLEQGEDTATCPSCSLLVRVIYDADMFVKSERISVGQRTTSDSATLKH